MVNTSTDNLTVMTKLTLNSGAAVSGLTIDHVQGLQGGLERKPNTYSPAFSGVPTAPTATSGTNTTQIATTEFVKSALDNLSGSAPALLNTLSELASALGDDENFAATVTTSLGLKAPLVSPELTGTPTAPTATAGTNTTQIATTEFVTSAVSAETSARTTAISTETSARNNALDTKVGLTGNQTIAGTKTFSSLIDGSINGNASTATTLQTARTIAGKSFNGSADIAISYLDLSDGSSLATSTYVNNVGDTKVNLTGNETIAGTKTFSSTIGGSINGNASTATTLQTARNIAGKSFNGSTDIAISYLDLSDGSSLATSTYVNNVGATKVGLTGNETIEGTKTFSSLISGSINGNASTATTLQTARNIAGQSFNGSADITIASTDLSDGSSVASKTYVDGKITDLLGADVPAALDTLKELATALNDDADFAGTVTTLLGEKAPSASPTFTGTVTFENIDSLTGITKTMVGLSNVDNTSDSAKVASGAIKDALDLKAPIDSPTFTGTVGGITATMVGLGNVDNTSDADKVASGAIKDALDAKASLSGATFTGAAFAPTATFGTNSTQIATTAFVTSAVSTKADLTLLTSGNVAIGANTAYTGQGSAAVAIGDAAAQYTQGTNAVAIGSLAGRESQGDSSVALGERAGQNTQGINAVAIGAYAGQNSQSQYAVGVGNNAGNTGQGVNAVAIGKNAGQNGQGAYAVAIGNSAGISNQSPNSIAINANSNALAAAAAGFYVNPIRSTSDNITTYLAYDTVLNEIQYKTLNAAAVGLGNVDNTSDAAKPISTATENALNLKAPIANPTFTGTVGGITAAMVGFSIVDGRLQVTINNTTYQFVPYSV